MSNGWWQVNLVQAQVRMRLTRISYRNLRIKAIRAQSLARTFITRVAFLRRKRTLQSDINVLLEGNCFECLQKTACSFTICLQEIPTLSEYLRKQTCFLYVCLIFDATAHPFVLCRILPYQTLTGYGCLRCFERTNRP